MMKPIRVQYLFSLSHWLEPVRQRLVAAGPEIEWLSCTRQQLEESVIGADLLLVDRAFTERSFDAIVGRRPTVLLLERCELLDACEWMGQGFDACFSLDAVDAVLSHLSSCFYRKNRQRELGAHEGSPELLQAVVDAVPVPIFYKDLHGRYLGGNREFERYSGFPMEELRGQTVYSVGTPELGDVYARADLDLLMSGGSQQYETQVPLSDGSMRDVELRKGVFHDPEGQVAGQVGVLLDITERNRLSERLRELANTDPLTGALNLRSFYEMAERHVNLYRRHGQSLSILVIDADYFKRINDLYGHAGGDLVLQTLVSSLQSLLRKEDTLFRVGGEEFYALLPHTDLREAQDVAERLRMMVECLVIEYSGRSIQVTVSIGAAEIRAGEAIPQCLRRADQALYEAKGKGRNRVMLEAC